MRPKEIYRRTWQAVSERENRFPRKLLALFDKYGRPEGVSSRAAGHREPAEIRLFGEIGGWGATADDFLKVLYRIDGHEDLLVRINSPGGDVFDGMAIFNLLKGRKGRVTCIVDGIAAGIAAVIAVAGTTAEIVEDSALVVCNTWGGVIGDRQRMTAVLNMQKTFDGQIAAIFGAKSGRLAMEFSALMSAELWLNASEAVAAGLCDEIIPRPDEMHTVLDEQSKSGGGAAASKLAEVNAA